MGAGADPFGGRADPFTAPVEAAFGGNQGNTVNSNTSREDPFLSGGGKLPAATSNSLAAFGNVASSISNTTSDDPFSLTLSNSLKPPQPASSDPFAPFGGPDGSKASAEPPKSASADLFGSDPFAPSMATTTQDDWFAFKPAPKVDGVPR